MSNTVLWIAFSLPLLGLLLYSLKFWAALKALKKHIPEATGPLPAVSILKPLKGMDERLYDNLESFCKLDYPSYELIFSMEDMADPAHKVVSRLRAMHPDVDIKVIVSRAGEGLNPKVRNLIPGLWAASHDLVLISDSNVSVRSDYLKSIVPYMSDPGVGLVSNYIRGAGARSVWAAMENLHLNSFVIGGVAALECYLRMPCVVGKSMLMRRSALDAVGGLEAVRDYLAEDFMLGKLMSEAGYGVLTSPYLIDNINVHWGPEKFLGRHVRWGKLRCHIGRGAYGVELLDNPVLMSMVALAIGGFSDMGLLLATGVCLSKCAGDYVLGRAMRSDPKWWQYLLVPAKDLLIGLAWFAPLLSRTVTWRGNACVIGKDSLLTPLYEGPKDMEERLANATR